MKTKQDNDMINRRDLAYAEIETELYLFDWMRSVRKTRQDNDMISHLGALYAENDTQLLLQTGSGADYEENHIGQLRD